MEEYRAEGIILTRYFAAYFEDIYSLAFADLHLGFESAMAEKGLFLPKFQFKYIREMVEKSIERYDPQRIIIVGDLKHQFSKNMPQEWGEVKEILQMISDRNPVIIRGNHDNYLRTILNRFGIKLNEVYRIGRYTFAHGHRAVDVRGFLVMGHEHPAIGLRDPVGGIAKFPCFVLGKNFLILPAMSVYSLGTDLIAQDELLTPLLSIEDLMDSRIIAITEKEGLIPLGTLRILREKFY